jgi:cobalt/nickel transport system permease protein
MADALLSPAVGAAAYAASAAAAGYSVKRLKSDELCEKKIPLTGVAGAFVFAAQMINFTIPGTGSSGHIGGGILLCGIVGEFPAFLAVCAILIIQCLFFADGGLLALGANIFNMGVVPCLLIYPLIFKPLIKNPSQKRLAAASVISCVLALQLGAFGVVAETLASGITALPFGTFVLFMQPIHLAIGIVEGVVTAAVLSFVYAARPEIIDAANTREPIRAGIKNVLIAFTILAVFTGAILSIFASSYPDGLEWSVEKTAGTPEIEAKLEIPVPAPMPDYENVSASGMIGGGLTFLAAGATAFIISRAKNRKRPV